MKALGISDADIKLIAMGGKPDAVFRRELTSKIAVSAAFAADPKDAAAIADYIIAAMTGKKPKTPLPDPKSKRGISWGKPILDFLKELAKEMAAKTHQGAAPKTAEATPFKRITGVGSQADPYIAATVEDLKKSGIKLGQYFSYKGQTYTLTKKPPNAAAP